MAVNDITEVVLFGVGDGKVPLINRFAYQQTAGASVVPASNLVTLFVTTVLPAIVGIVSSSTVFTHVDGVQLTGGHDVFSLPLTTGNVGTSPATYLPPNNCWSFRYFRASSASRNGQKRFGLVAVGDTLDGVAHGTIIPVLATTASTLGSALSDGTNVYEPRILRVKLNGAPVVPPQVFSISSVGYVSIGSQNSRKFNKH